MSDFPANDTDELEVKKRARRRLVGAAALALLAVVVLPLAMDDDAPVTVPDLQVSIPGRGEAPTPVKVDIEPDAASGVPEPAGTPPPASVPTPTLPTVPAASPPEPPVQPPPASTPPAPPSTASSSSATPPSTPPASAQDGDDARRRQREAEAARALALLNDGAAAREPARGSSPSAGKKLFIQVGAFGDAARAAALASELKKQGFAAYAEKAGRVTRVRIGPLPKADAEQAVSRLKAQGRDAKLMSR